MRPKQQNSLTMYGFRLDPHLVERLDAFASDKTRIGPLRYTRVDALRVLLSEGLDRHAGLVEPKQRR